MESQEVIIDYDSLDGIVTDINEAELFLATACKDILAGNAGESDVSTLKIEEDLNTLVEEINDFNASLSGGEQSVLDILGGLGEEGRGIDLGGENSPLLDLLSGEYNEDNFLEVVQYMIDVMTQSIEAKEAEYLEKFGENSSSILDFRFTYEQALELYQNSIASIYEEFESSLSIKYINMYLQEEYDDENINITYQTLVNMHNSALLEEDNEKLAKIEEIIIGGFSKYNETHEFPYEQSTIDYHLNQFKQTFVYAYENQKQITELLQPAVDLANEIRAEKEAKRQMQIYSYSHILQYSETKNYTEKDMLKVLDEETLHFLSLEEAAIYTYLVNNNRSGDASDYLSLMEDTINQRKGMSMAMDYVEDIVEKEGDWFYDYLRSSGEGTWDGIINFGEGFVNFFSPDGKVSPQQYKQQYIMMMLSQEYDMDKIGEQYSIDSKEYQMYEKMSEISYNWLLNFGYQTGTSFGNMLPAMAIGWIPVVGKPLAMGGMFISSSGNAVENAYQRGTTGLSAYLYGSLLGLSEVSLEYLLGGIPILSKTSGLTFKSLFGEGLEEALQTFIETGANYAFFGDTISLGELAEDELKSFGMGMFMSFCMNGGALTINLGTKGVKTLVTSDIECFMKNQNGEVSFDAKSFGQYLLGITSLSNGNYQKALDTFLKSGSLSLLGEADIKTLLSNANTESLANTILNADDSTVSLLLKNMTPLEISSICKGLSETQVASILNNCDIETVNKVNALIFENRLEMANAEFKLIDENIQNGATVPPEANIANEIILKYMPTITLDSASLSELYLKLKEQGYNVTPESLYGKVFNMNVETSIKEFNAEADKIGEEFKAIDEFIKAGGTLPEAGKISDDVILKYSSNISLEAYNFADIYLSLKRDGIDITPKQLYGKLYEMNVKQNGESNQTVAPPTTNESLIPAEVIDMGNLEVGIRIRNEIINKILGQGLKNPLEIARLAYIELNKRVHYNYKYVEADIHGDKSMQHQLYIKNTSFEAMTSEEVVCSSWAMLYSELLQELGYDKNSITISKKPGASTLTHEWVEVDLNGNGVLVADPAVMIKHSNDLINCKYGERTAGFVVLNGSLNGRRLDYLVRDGDEALYQHATHAWENIDRKIGYNNNGNYYMDTIDTFGKLFGGISTTRMNNARKCRIIEDASANINPNMDGFEAVTYLNSIKHSLFQNNEVKVVTKRMGKYNADGELVGYSMMCIPENNYYMIYSKTTGTLVFENQAEMDAYIYQNQIFKTLY